jgi:hypothetical protein
MGEHLSLIMQQKPIAYITIKIAGASNAKLLSCTAAVVTDPRKMYVIVAVTMSAQCISPTFLLRQLIQNIPLSLNSLPCFCHTGNFKHIYFSVQLGTYIRHVDLTF